MVKQTGSPNYKIVEIDRILAIVEEHLSLGKDEWEERVATDCNLIRVEQDLESLQRKFKSLYSMPNPTGTVEMPPHVKKAKLAKRSIDDKANIVEIDDEADEDEEDAYGQESNELFVEPDFSFDPLLRARFGCDESDTACDQVVNVVLVILTPSRHADSLDTCNDQVVVDGLKAFAPTPGPAPLTSVSATRQLRSSGLKKPRKASTPSLISSETAVAAKTTKTPAARGLRPGSRDEDEAHRHASLQSTSNRLGGSNLYSFRDSVGEKRAREGDD
ncbi:hypothetical protein PF005_g12758 [Phytophthora fragariae]|uniref:DUF6818 domain-containing protein n=2 Tax=Phytophthora fragariae TaxID=53985 RepID=A0A6A3RBC4_9STRA|nr:hypothetical protein PF007_g18326 [Phytophthora fragariae]KAE9207075.1 hypothetical protein PF005_g12758 [Phytophthora fragariae]KAE9295014.1 hypothetical protein PF001_g17515 [Phytophthora fragariae]